MKYFTPDLIERFGSLDDDVATAADAEYEALQTEHEKHLRRIEPELPAPVREFNQLLLHDARVWSIARKGEQLLMVLHKQIPPRELVILSYTLTEEPYVNAEALPPRQRCPVMDFLYDELDLSGEGDRKQYTQSILFSNGWEMRLRFRDIRVTRAEPLYPVPSMPFSPTSTGAVGRSA